MQSMVGYCEKHQIDKLMVGLGTDLEAVCVRCQADATPKLGRRQVVEDPGEGFFHGKGTDAKITVLDAPHGAVQPTTRRPVVVAGGLTLEEIVEVATAQLGNLPMPKDIAHFKKVQKVIKTLRKLVENSDGR